MRNKGRFGLWRFAGLTTIAALVAALVVLVPGAFGGGVTGAAFTTTNTNADGTGHCKNGNEDVNCNIYDGKDFVWLNGGPSTAYVGDGDYFFAVLAPGGQHDPLDGAANNLSDLSPSTGTGAGDAYTNRTFTVTGGVVSYLGSHDFDGNKIRLMGYDDTTNNGGVYILAICSLKDGYDAVTPSNCKYDAFKVAEGDTTTPDAAAPTVSKDASGAYNTTYTWDSAKSVASPTTVNLTGGSATFHYTITATHSAGTNSGIGVSGTIQVFNSNADDIIVHVSDALSDSTPCTVKDGATTIGANDDVTVSNPSKSLSYSCSISGSSVPSGLTNTVTVTWPEQLLNDGSHLVANSTGITYTTGTISFTQNKIDECTTLTDTFDGSATTLGVACVGNSPPFAKDAGNTLSSWAASYAAATRTFTFTYNRTVAAPSHGCVTKNNTATFVTNDNSLGDPTTGDNSASVTVCRLVSGLTIGYWQNKNGQGRITANSAGHTCAQLYTYLHQFAPFSGLTSSTCGTSAGLTGKNTPSTGVAGWVYDVIKAANASGANMDAMLRAQMLATALNVFFGVTNGTDVIDLVHGCKMIDNSGGTATCSGAENWSPAFNNQASMSVNDMLSWAAANFSYGGSKAMQGLAKDAFDAINNSVALTV